MPEPVAPVTISALAKPPDPAPYWSGPVAWYRSQRFIALLQSTILFVLGWLIAALSTGDWSWKAGAVAVLGNVLIALKDWWSPNVVAPFAVLNQNNVPPKG